MGTRTGRVAKMIAKAIMSRIDTSNPFTAPVQRHETGEMFKYGSMKKTSRPMKKQACRMYFGCDRRKTVSGPSIPSNAMRMIHFTGRLLPAIRPQTLGWT